MASEKIISRVRKLIELAVGTTYTEEGASAAYEAVRLIHKHGISIGEPPPSPSRSRRKSSENPYESPSWIPPVAPTRWKYDEAPYDTRCAICHGPIRIGQKIWLSPERGIVHENWADGCRDFDSGEET